MSQYVMCHMSYVKCRHMSYAILSHTTTLLRLLLTIYIILFYLDFYILFASYLLC